MAQRGRPSKPTSRHKHEGTYRPDRHGKRTSPEDEAEQAAAEIGIADPPAPDELIAPEHLDDDTRSVWTEVAAYARAAGVDVRHADTYVLEAASVALVNARRARMTLARLGSRYYESRYGVSLHPAARDEKMSWEAFHKAGSMLGLSPLDRERLQATANLAADDGDPLLGIHQRRTELKVVKGGAS